MGRDLSESSLSSMQAETNQNVNYFSSRAFWLAYLIAIAIFRLGLLYFMPKWLLDGRSEWTVTFLVHGLVRLRARERATTFATWARLFSGTHSPFTVPLMQITFIGLHWNRGTPIWTDQGEHVEKTVWEQIDNGVPWTAARKFLLIVPVAMCVLLLDATPRPLHRLHLVPRLTSHSTLLCRHCVCRYMITVHMTGYHIVHTTVNTLVLLILVAAKLPEMHGVRLFHMNEAKVD